MKRKDGNRPNGPSPRPADGLDPEGEIATRLTALYESVVEEGIPDKFLHLLEKLDEAERKSDGRGGRC